MDEPTSNLDQVAMRQLHDLIAKKKREGCTIVIAEHRLAWIADLTDRLILFERGTITREWNHDELMQLDDKLLHQYGLRSLNLKSVLIASEETNNETTSDARHRMRKQ